MEPKLEVIEDEQPLPMLPKLDHTLLEMWRDVLSHIETEQEANIRPAEVLAILRSWPAMELKDISRFRTYYYEHLLEMRNALDKEIESDPEALKHVEDDAEYNREKYIRLILRWKRMIVHVEEAWDIDEEDAYAQMAAIAEASSFAISDMGLVAHLAQIGINPTEEERLAIEDKLRNESE